MVCFFRPFPKSPKRQLKLVRNETRWKTSSLPMRKGKKTERKVIETTTIFFRLQLYRWASQKTKAPTKYVRLLYSVTDFVQFLMENCPLNCFPFGRLFEIADDESKKKKIENHFNLCKCFAMIHSWKFKIEAGCQKKLFQVTLFAWFPFGWRLNVKSAAKNSKCAFWVKNHIWKSKRRPKFVKRHYCENKTRWHSLSVNLTMHGQKSNKTFTV